MLKMGGHCEPYIECVKCNKAINGNVYRVGQDDYCQACLLKTFDMGNSIDVAVKRLSWNSLHGGEK